MRFAVAGERPRNQCAGAAVQVAARSQRKRSGGAEPRAAAASARPEVAVHVERRKLCVPGRTASAEELTRRWPRGWAAPRGWEGTTAGPPRDALPAPSLRTPPPSLRRARSAAVPVRSGRIRPSQAGPDSHPGPWASAFALDREKHRALLSSRGGRERAGRPNKAGRPRPRPGPARARRGAEPGAGARFGSLPGAPEPGAAAPAAASRACASPCRSFPQRSATSFGSCHGERVHPSGPPRAV